MPNESLNETDKKILSILERDARRSVVSIAKDIHLSRSAVQTRIERLEAKGVIAQYTIVRGNFSRKCTKSLMLIGCTNRIEIFEKLRDVPEIIACWAVAGEMDAVLLVETPDAEALDDFGIHLSRIEGIRSIRTVPILRTHRQRQIDSRFGTDRAA